VAASLLKVRHTARSTRELPISQWLIAGVTAARADGR
jgi:hypothetical protein